MKTLGLNTCVMLEHRTPLSRSLLRHADVRRTTQSSLHNLSIAWLIYHRCLLIFVAVRINPDNLSLHSPFHKGDGPTVYVIRGCRILLVQAREEKQKRRTFDFLPCHEQPYGIEEWWHEPSTIGDVWHPWQVGAVRADLHPETKCAASNPASALRCCHYACSVR